jgi:hypothetical protein
MTQPNSSSLRKRWQPLNRKSQVLATVGALVALVIQIYVYANSRAQQQIIPQSANPSVIEEGQASP